MSRSQRARFIVLAALGLLVVAAAGGIVFRVEEAHARPMERHCSFNQDKIVDYYASWPPVVGAEVGRKFEGGCGSNHSYQWGQVTSFPVTTCMPCNQP